MSTSAPRSDPRHLVLADAAFGAHPGLAAAELPVAADALGRWYRALVLGGQGRYAAARVELRIVRTSSIDPVMLSLAASTEGSLLRQLGWHDAAAKLDGRAAALILSADAVRGNRADQVLGHTDAVCDAVTGLAADALGVGRLALARRLLRRMRPTVEEEQTGWRPRRAIGT